MNLKKYVIVDSKYSILIGCSLILIAVSFLSGCLGFIQKSQESKLVVINVLDSSYYQDCHITGSINIPFDQFEDSLSKLDKNNTYVLYCSNYACIAAPHACQLMKDAGFTHVEVLPGGIVEWYQKKLPYQGDALLQYLQEENQELDHSVHANVSTLTAEQLFEKMKTAKLL